MGEGRKQDADRRDEDATERDRAAAERISVRPRAITVRGPKGCRVAWTASTTAWRPRRTGDRRLASGRAPRTIQRPTRTQSSRTPEPSAAERLEALGVRGILRQLARDGQIVNVRCEMPQCYCFRGREHFDQASDQSDWSPTADHYPRLKMHGGHLTPDNVRLAHRLCNRRDYEWRTRITAMLGKRMSLEEIAADLNAHEVPTIHGTNEWTASAVRKAFVS